MKSFHYINFSVFRYMTYIKSAFHTPTRVLTKLSRRSWLFGIVVLLTGFLLSMSLISPSAPTSQAEKLVVHYTALLAQSTQENDTDALNRTLATLMLEESVIAASVFSPAGEQLAQSGKVDTFVGMVRTEPALQSVFTPIIAEDTQQVVGYLSILYRPNTDR